MKKLLALVLALVMTLSLCVTSNAAFTDAKDVDADFEEAVAVLNGMGVFKGYEDGSFKPEGNITRAEVAAIVYRLYTGDVKDKQAGLYAGYGKFDDMANAQWAAGYVGFCANAGFVKGYGNGKFGPSDQVTGYQALAMILRAVGYGQNGEFEGADWELHVASIAQQLKVLKNVKDVSLKTAASRQLVAELLFQVAAKVNTVTYTPAFGYQDKALTDTFASNTAKNETLGEKNFDLVKVEDKADDWGRPCYKWTNQFNGYNANGTLKPLQYTAKDHKDYVCYATIADTPVMTFTVATKQCDILAELGETKALTIEDTFRNGDNTVTNVAVGDVSTKLGAQGQLVEIYDVTKDNDAKNQYRVVIVDTYLAKVTKVVEEKVDSKDHITRDAYLQLTVYNNKAKFTAESTQYVAGNDYAKGDYILVNWNDKVNADITGLTSDTVHYDLLEVVGLADSLDGVQTKRITSGKRTIDGTEYDEAETFVLNKTNFDGSKKYTWFFDQYGNLIGDVAIDDVYNYGVVTFLEKVDAVGEADYVVANVKYANEEEATAVKVASIKRSDTAGAYDYINRVNYNSANNKNLFGDDDGTKVLADHLFRIDTNKDGELLLVDTPETTGSITTKGTTIVRDSNPLVKIDDATVFMIRSGKGTSAKPYTFEFVTGKNNVGKYSDQDFHYVLDADNDNYAKYIYIIGDAKPVMTYKFVFVTSTNMGVETFDRDDNTTEYVEFYAVNMDGSDAELKVKKTELTAELKTALTNKGDLVMVTLKDGYVTDFTPIGADGCAIALTDGDKLEALCFADGDVAGEAVAAVEYHSLENVDMFKETTYAKYVNLNMTDVTVLLDGVKKDASYLTDDMLVTEKVQSVYVVRSSKANEDHLATAVVLSTYVNDQDCSIDHTTPKVTVTMTGEHATNKLDPTTYTAGEVKEVVVTAENGYHLTSVTATGCYVVIDSTEKFATVTIPATATGTVEIVVEAEGDTYTLVKSVSNNFDGYTMKVYDANDSEVGTVVVGETYKFVFTASQAGAAANGKQCWVDNDVSIMADGSNVVYTKSDNPFADAAAGKTLYTDESGTEATGTIDVDGTYYLKTDAVAATATVNYTVVYSASGTVGYCVCGGN